MAPPHSAMRRATRALIGTGLAVGVLFVRRWRQALPACVLPVKCLNDIQYLRRYRGELSPPRPGPEDFDAGRAWYAAASDPHMTLQKGPYNSVWFRVSRASDPALVIKAVEQWLEEYSSSDGCGAFFVVIPEVSVTLPQVVSWLLAKQFKYHHYLGAGATDAGGGGQSGEFVYYKWCKTTIADHVPAYSTSIEGVGCLVLSPDQREVLLVWEYGNWKSVSGAVDPGESLLTAGAREVWEEVGLRLCPDFKPCLLGGYQKARARDALVNDNFHSLVVRAKSKDFKVDGVEIALAKWFPVETLLQVDEDPEREPLPFQSGVPGKETVSRSTVQRLRGFLAGKYMELREGEDNVVSFGNG